MLAFELYAGNSLDGPFLLWPKEHDVSYSLLVRPQYLLPLCISPFQKSSSPKKSVVFLGVVFLHSTVLICICGCSDKQCLLTTVCQSIPEPVGDIHHRNMPVFNAVASEGSWMFRCFSWTFFVVFGLAFNSQRFLWIPWNLMILLYTVEGEIPKILAITCSGTHFFDKSVNLDPSLLIKD